jgi:hypothetical protein
VGGAALPDDSDYRTNFTFSISENSRSPVKNGISSRFATEYPTQSMVESFFPLPDASFFLYRPVTIIRISGCLDNNHRPDKRDNPLDIVRVIPANGKCDFAEVEFGSYQTIGLKRPVILISLKHLNKGVRIRKKRSHYQSRSSSLCDWVSIFQSGSNPKNPFIPGLFPASRAFFPAPV